MRGSKQGDSDPTIYCHTRVERKRPRGRKDRGNERGEPPEVLIPLLVGVIEVAEDDDRFKTR